MLAVIAILGILAGLAVPALKDLGKSNSSLGASRQLLDDVGRARQLAMANRTTVYMVFIPTNFWGNLTTAEKAMSATTNLIDKQLTGYTFVSLRSVGDQPGNPSRQYLAPWQSLPDGTFINAQKFSTPGTVINNSVSDPVFNSWDSDYPHSDQNQMYAFTNVALPFPTQTNNNFLLPCIAFNYLGQLTSDGVNLAGHDEYIPLAKGNVSYAIDPVTRASQLTAVTASAITESPPGNSTGISYNIIHIDALTGRAVLEFHKIGP